MCWSRLDVHVSDMGFTLAANSPLGEGPISVAMLLLSQTHPCSAAVSDPNPCFDLLVT